MPLGLPSLLPGYAAAPPSAEFMRRRTMGQSARNAIGTATAAGGGLAGARAGAQQAMQGGIDAGFQASQLAAQEAQAEAARRQQYMDSQSGLSRGLLSGLGGALGATGSSEGGAGQQVLGLAGSLAPLLLASDRRLKSDLRGATSEDIEAVRQLLRARAGQAQPSQQSEEADALRELTAERRSRRRIAAEAPVRERQAELDNLHAQASRLRETVPARSFRGPNGPVGVVAQDVERAVPSMVRRIGPQGVRAIDVPQMTGVLAAGQSDAHRRAEEQERRLQRLERALRGRGMQAPRAGRER